MSEPQAYIQLLTANRENFTNAQRDVNLGNGIREIFAVSKINGNHEPIGFQFLKQFGWTLDEAKKWLRENRGISLNEATPTRAANLKKDIEDAIAKKQITEEQLRNLGAQAQGGDVLRRSFHSLEIYAKTPEERKAEERDEVMIKAMETIARYVDNARTFRESCPMPTVNELKFKAETFDEYQLRQSIDEAQTLVEKAKKFSETVAAKKAEIIGDICVAHGTPRNSFSSLSEDAKREIEAEAEEEVSNLYKKSKTVEKALPLFEEVRDIFIRRLERLNSQKPTEKEVQETTKRLTKLSKSADKIIAQVERVIYVITYDRPTDERLAKAILLVKSYRAIEREFTQVNKKLEPFGIHVDVGLRSLPILPNSVKKVLSSGGE